MSAATIESNDYTVHIRIQRTTIESAVYAVLAIIAAGGIFMGAMGLSTMAGAESGEVEIRQVEKQPLEKEWVWKKQSPRFDHMWRVPR
jgi:purine-cytosine permease-like protein